MSAAQVFIGVILPYVTVVVFVVGIVYRIKKWNKAPAGKMTLFSAPATPSEKWKQILKEVLVFKQLFDGNKSLWAGTWIFHAALALIIVGHSRVVTDFPLLWAALGMSNANVDTMSNVVGGAAGVIVLAMGMYLLVRRLVVSRVAEISDTDDYVCLGLILAIVISGDILRFGPHFDLNLSRQYFAGLLTFQGGPVPSNPWFLLHLFLGQILIMYVPFSKFLHIPGIFYSKSLIYQR
ncbi:MAG: respiratory nitrate reductase subunit gamma [Thermodesulfobacteriota bacterium]